MARGPVDLDALLDAIGAHAGVRGAAVLRRDGLPEQVRIPGALSEEVFAAMCATLLAATETAANEFGGQAVTSVTARLARGALLVAPLGREHLVAVILREATDPHPLHERLLAEIARAR